MFQGLTHGVSCSFFLYDFTKFFMLFPEEPKLFQFVEHWISSELHKTEISIPLFQK